MIDAALVGLGWWGRQHLDSVQGKSDRLRYVRAVTLEPEAASGLVAGHGITVSTDYDDALADPAVAAVVLATPHSLHADQVAAAAAAGKHVFCEKPFTLTKDAAEAAIAACTRAGLALGIGQNRRFWPSMKEIKGIVASGEIGTVMHVEANYSHDILAEVPATGWRASPEEAPAAGMTGMGVHITDAYIDMIGPIAEVHALCVDRTLGRAAGDTVSVLLRFADGPTGYLASTFKTAFIWHFRVLGSEGIVESRGERDVSVTPRKGEPRSYMLEPVDSVRAEIEAFADAIEGKAPYPIPADQIIHNVAVLEAIFESAATRRTVTVR